MLTVLFTAPITNHPLVKELRMTGTSGAYSLMRTLGEGAFRNQSVKLSYYAKGVKLAIEELVARALQVWLAHKPQD
jgi:hypothetical protein